MGILSINISMIEPYSQKAQILFRPSLVKNLFHPSQGSLVNDSCMTKLKFDRNQSQVFH